MFQVILRFTKRSIKYPSSSIEVGSIKSIKSFYVMGEGDKERTAVPRLIKTDTQYLWMFDICALDSHLCIVNKNITTYDSQKCQDGKLLVFLKH